MSDIKRVNVNGSGSVINPDYNAKLNHTDASLFTTDALKYIAGYNPANGINMQNAVDVLAKKHTSLESKAAYVLDSDSNSDLDLTDEEGNVLTRFSDGHIQTLNFDSSVMTTRIDTLEEISETHPYVKDQPIDTSLVSLDISDESGYVLARFSNGHIQTKFFDSSIITTKLDNIDNDFTVFVKSDLSNANLNIGDENGYVIAQFKNGHIKTKNFDSSSITTEASPVHLKLLVVGNSYSQDSFSYVPFILKNYGITIELGIYFRGGGSLQNHIDEWNSNTYSLHFIDTRTQNSWTTYSNYSPLKSVQFLDWDIIVLQQMSSASVDGASFIPEARNLINLILNNINNSKTVQFAWNININRKSSGTGQTIENTILQNIKTCIDREPINFIFPYGTAIFNARTNETLNAIGDGGNLWASDLIHLQEGLPCYIAALTNVQTLFNKFYPKYSVMNDMTRPTTANIQSWQVPGQNGSAVGITEDNCRLAQICAILANNKPFEISTIYS